MGGTHTDTISRAMILGQLAHASIREKHGGRFLPTLLLKSSSREIELHEENLGELRSVMKLVSKIKHITS